MRYFQRLKLNPKIERQLAEKTSKDWGKLTEEQRKEIVKRLIIAQKALCAYCECAISDHENEHHIEHFVERHDDKDKIFDYTNMLLSCQSNTIPSTTLLTPEEKLERKRNISCGHGKEKYRHKEDKINYDHLLNPTNNVSALFSYFDGIIEPATKCTEIEVKQINYTIKRLNLDAITVENARKKEIVNVQIQLEGLTDTEQKMYIRSLLDETQAKLNPYFSTIKDNFGFLIAV